MLIKMRNIWQIWKDHHTPTNAGAPTLSAAQQTRASWAKSIRSYAAVPDVYKEFFKSLQAEGREFPYTILTPAFEGLIQGSTEKLICDFGNEIYVLERNRNIFEAQCYPVENITYFRERTVLLDTCITISGVTKSGFPATTNIKFNSVTDFLFAPILKSMRFTAVKSREPALSSELKKFDHLAESYYKFMNYGRHSLLGEEKVLYSILQPEIRKSKFRSLSKIYYKLISPAHMSILTDRELIMIREERQPGGGKYGGAWEYIPLDKITKLAVSERAENLVTLSVQLLDNIQLEYIFQATARSEVDQLTNQYRDLTMRQSVS